MIEYAVHTAEEDLVCANLLWLKWHRSWKFQARIVGGFFVAYSIFFVALHVFTGGKLNAYALEVGLTGGVATAAIVPFVVHILVRLLMLRRARKQFRQMKSLHVEAYVGWSDTDLSSRSEITQTRLPWSHFLQWGERKNTIVLFQSDNAFNIIPKRGVPEQALAALRGYLVAAGVKEIDGRASR